MNSHKRATKLFFAACRSDDAQRIEFYLNDLVHSKCEDLKTQISQALKFSIRLKYNNAAEYLILQQICPVQEMPAGSLLKSNIISVEWVFSLACELQNKEIATLLLNCIHTNEILHDCFYGACDARYLDLVSLIIEKATDPNDWNSWFRYVCEYGIIEVVQELIGRINNLNLNEGLMATCHQNRQIEVGRLLITFQDKYQFSNEALFLFACMTMDRENIACQMQKPQSLYIWNCVFYHAIKNHDMILFEMLIDKSASVYLNFTFLFSHICHFGTPQMAIRVKQVSNNIRSNINDDFQLACENENIAMILYCLENGAHNVFEKLQDAQKNEFLVVKFDQEIYTKWYSPEEVQLFINLIPNLLNHGMKLDHLQNIPKYHHIWKKHAQTQRIMGLMGNKHVRNLSHCFRHLVSSFLSFD